MYVGLYPERVRALTDNPFTASMCVGHTIGS